MFYVRLDDITDAQLSFLGYTCVAEEGSFKMYRDHRAEEYIVDTSNPYIYVDDVNDAIAIVNITGSLDIVSAPPKA